VDGKQVAVVKNIQLEPGTQFNPENTIMDNNEIVNGLLTAINEFKQKMNSISPETVLRKAVATRSELQGGGRNRRLNENVFDQMVKDVIKKLKK
jgi:hypothetical protein